MSGTRPPHPEKLKALLSVALALLLPSLLLAEKEEAKRTYRVMEGYASSTLRQIAVQGEFDILLAESLVKGVRTPPLVGRFTPEEALRKLLQGTGLMAVRGKNSGSFTVVSARGSSTDPNDDTPVPDEYGDSEANNSPNSNSGNLFRRMLTAMGIVDSSLTDRNQLRDEIFDLSPFVVQASQNTYAATSTLAGTRVRTNISDIGASISILTKQLFDDLAADDAQSVLQIVPNLEVGGVLGNFSAAGATNSVYEANSSRITPEAAQRVRGLVRAQLTRNYFQTEIPFDSYNTSQITINRGPNSVLFGLGAPGGVIENSMILPLAMDFTEMEIRFSHFGGHRESLDLNRTLLGGRLNLRTALLNERKKFRQEEAFEDDVRRFLAWDYALFDPKQNRIPGRTTFRGYVETGEIRSTPPDVIPPSIGYNFWWNPLDLNALLNRYGGIERAADLPSHLVPASEGGTWIPKATIVNTDTSTFDRTAVLQPNFIQFVQVFEEPEAAAPSFQEMQGFMPRTRWDNPRGTQDYAWTDGRVDLPGFTLPTLQDRKVFDFVNHLFTGRTNRVERNFDVQEFTLDQQFLEGAVGIEFTYNDQWIERSVELPWSDSTYRTIHLDISELIPIPISMPHSPGDMTAPLRANPNLGRPVMRSIFHKNHNESAIESVRTTAFVTHDFRDHLDDRWGKWLGRHILSALLQNFNNTTRQITYGMSTESDEVDVGGSNILNHRRGDFRREAIAWAYLGDSGTDLADPGQLRLNLPLRLGGPVSGDRFKSYVWDNSASQVRTAEFFPFYFPRVNGSNISRQDVESYALILQSHWLDDHLITLFAARRDEVANFEIIPEARQRLPDGTLDISLLRLQKEPSFEQTGETVTSSYVLKYPESHLGDLPMGADLRFHFFKSETFQPSRTGRTIDGQLVGNPGGGTTEYGFTLDLLEGRLFVRLNRYETSSIGARNNTALNIFNQWVGSGAEYLRRAAEFESLGAGVIDIPGALKAGFTDWDSYYAAIMSITPPELAEMVDIRFDRDRAVVEGTPIDGLTSTFDFISKGMEFELVGSITDNWNIFLNVSQQKTVQTNILPGVLEYAEQVEINIIQAGLADVVDSPALGEPRTFLDRWRSQVMFPIRSERAKDGQKSHEQREWRWNVVSSYRFDAGPLSGSTFGVVARWQDASAIGYPVIINEDGFRVNDISRPYFGETEFNLDLWISHTRRIWQNIVWKIQINVRNLIGGGGGDLIPLAIDPLGDVSAVRLPVERQIILSNSFKF